MGLKAHGQDLIARGHNQIFATVFRKMPISAAVQFERPAAGLQERALAEDTRARQ